MTIADIRQILKATVVCGGEHLEKEVHTACGSDMMSDVLAFVKDQSVLLTGLVNPQVVRTADMMDMVCIVSVSYTHLVSSPQTNAPAPKRMSRSKSKPESKIFLPSRPYSLA